MIITKHPRQYGHVASGVLYDGHPYSFAGFTRKEAMAKALGHIEAQKPVSITFKRTNKTFKLV